MVTCHLISPLSLAGGQHRVCVTVTVSLSLSFYVAVAFGPYMQAAAAATQHDRSFLWKHAQLHMLLLLHVRGLHRNAPCLKRCK